MTDIWKRHGGCFEEVVCKAVHTNLRSVSLRHTNIRGVIL